MMADQPTLPELVAQREFACRLAPERALATLEEAEAYLVDRGMLTLTPECALPSLFGACHEAPASGAQGFGAWPRTKTQPLLDRLLESGQLNEPAPGWLATDMHAHLLLADVV
jgi:hypothetical protein